MYSVEVLSPFNHTKTWFDTAHEAMNAVNLLRALRASELVIQNEAGMTLTDRQLAVIVMEAVLHNKTNIAEW